MEQLVNSFNAIRAFVDGKKQMVAALGAALTATGFILTNAKTQGWAYISTLPHTPEFATASVAWIGFFNALKGEKIRQAIDALPPSTIQNQNVTVNAPTVTAAPAPTPTDPRIQS